MNDSERTARRDFHLALPFGIFPGVGALVSFALSRREVKGVWGRRIRWLAAIDLLVVLSLATLVVFGLPRVPPKAKARIGIQPKDAKPVGVGVESVFAGSPAERAGLKPADVILQIDGVVVLDMRAFIEQLNRRPAEPRELTVQRGESRLRISVTPEKATEMSALQPAAGSVWQPWVMVQIGLSLTALGWLALRARAKQTSMLPALLVLGSLVFASLVQQLVFWIISKKLGGITTVGWLLSATCFSASLLAASAWSMRFAVRRGLIPAPNWDPPQASLVGRGLLYIVSLGVRAGFIAWAVWTATGLVRLLPAGDPWGIADELPRWGALLFAFDAVAIAPAAEEVLFRGIFLPWLERFLTPRNALVVSAAVFGLQHIAYGPGALFIVVVGLVLGWARQRTGGLAAPLFIHTVNNGFVTLLRLTR